MIYVATHIVSTVLYYIVGIYMLYTSFARSDEIYCVYYSHILLLLLLLYESSRIISNGCAGGAIQLGKPEEINGFT